MISRRDVLKLGAAGITMPALLVACGTETNSPSEPTATPQPTEIPVAVGTPLGQTSISGEPSYSASKSVSTFHGTPSRTGAMPGPGPRRDVPIIFRWKYDLGGDGTTSPIVVDGVVYIAVRKAIIALDESSGNELWQYGVNDSVYCTPSVSDGILYFGSNNDHLYAIDARTGEGIWKSNVGNAIHGSPAIEDGIVYITTIGSGRITEEYSSRGAEGMLIALNASNGNELWRFVMTGLSYCAPAVENGVVFVNCMEGFLYAINAFSGVLLWTSNIGSSRWISPAVQGGKVYVPGENATLYALRTTDGNEVWRFQMGDSLRSSPTVENGVVYVGSSNGITYALDSRLGRELWRRDWGGNFYTNYSPSVVGGMVYVGLTALHEGTGDWLAGYEYSSITSVSSSQNSSQSVVNGCVYAVTNEYLLAIGNLHPTRIAESVVLRGAPSSAGVSYGTINAGDQVSSILSREEVNGETWFEVLIGGETGWIPASVVESGTLPPEGPIEYIYTPSPSMVPTPTPQPSPTPAPTSTPAPTPTPVGGFASGDLVVTTEEAELRARAGSEWHVIAVLPTGTELEIVGEAIIKDSGTWFEVRKTYDGEGGFLPSTVMRRKES